MFGGTFDPVHNGHKTAALAFTEQMKLDRLFVIPVYRPPHKRIEGSDDPARRLEMCKIAFADVPEVEVSDMEIRRKGNSYTVDTLSELSKKGRELFLLCGTDMMLSFDLWHEFRRIFALCRPVYARRERSAALDAAVEEKNREYAEKYGIRFEKIVTEPVDISSTEIREMLGQGLDVSKYVPSGVARYIKENGLYAG